ncbi:MAG: SEL1-like repeat protein [Methylacidiphilales bacterium]|nr:SEL1-like repeat protein [Candidatus Methylacidiphilales bacterium]
MTTAIKASKEEFQLHLKDAREGDSYAQSWIGNAFDLGLGVKIDLAQALKWHKLAAENGEAYSQSWMGWALDRGSILRRSLTKSFKWYKKAALQGYANGQYCVGQSYAEGQGVSKNLKLAVKWWRKAADQSYQEAQVNLGKALEEGLGVRKNIQLAKKLYQAAARQGDFIAKYNLARLKMRSGLRSQAQKEFKAIIPELKKLAKQKDKTDYSAELCLGDCVYNGWGIRVNKRQAARWYRVAARQKGGPVSGLWWQGK